MAQFTESLIAHVLEHEMSSTRFEDFCVELFRDSEQVEFVRTGASWDLGVDGRPSGIAAGPYICASLRSDVKNKVLSDVEKILKNAHPTEVLICSNEAMSEHTIDSIQAEVRKLGPGIHTVRINGLRQLSQLAIRHPRSAEQLYAGELAELRGALRFGELPSGESLKGLRIALTTQLHTDGQIRRDQLVRVLVLVGLRQNETSAMSTSALASTVSQSLHLPRAVKVAFIQPTLDRLVDELHATLDEGKYRVTSEGLKWLESREAEASNSFSGGQVEIRSLLEDLSGDPVSDSEWKVIWNILQDGLSAMFLKCGSDIIDSVAALSQGSTSGVGVDFHQEIEGIANKIRAIPGGGARLQEIAQSVVDMFQERSSSAFAWLSDLCTIYVDMCALGLEPTAQSQVVGELQRTDLLIDTDIALSLLSPAEPDHDAVLHLVQGWRSVGGRVFVALPVLEEAAHHAWISENEYARVWHQLAGMDSIAATRVVENVFVRGFHKESKSGYSPKQWQAYISAFKGRTDHDYDKILALLADCGVELLSGVIADGPRSQYIEEQLYKKRKAATSLRKLEALREKCSRDARMIAMLMAARPQWTSGLRRLSIVSSSRAIRQAAAMYESQFQSGNPVIYPGSAAWMLSLAPGACLSLGSLRGIMFDPGHRMRMQPFDRIVMRSLQASKQYSMHWSRRPTLIGAVRSEIDRIAFQRGEAGDALVDRIVNEEEGAKEVMTEALAEALDKVSTSRSEEEIGILKARVAELEVDLERERRKKK